MPRGEVVVGEPTPSTQSMMRTVAQSYAPMGKHSRGRQIRGTKTTRISGAVAPAACHATRGYSATRLGMDRSSEGAIQQFSAVSRRQLPEFGRAPSGAKVTGIRWLPPTTS